MEYFMDPHGYPCIHALILRAKHTFYWLLYIHVCLLIPMQSVPIGLITHGHRLRMIA